MPRQRADLPLVERGFFENRIKAREAIAAGLLCIDAKPLRKRAEPISADGNREILIGAQR